MSSLSFSFQNPLKANIGDQFFGDLPASPGVYFFLDENREPLYIGKAESLRKRLASYRLAKPGGAPEHILEMIEHAREIKFEAHLDGAAALRRESELIRSLKPPFNIAGTDPIPFLFLGLRVVSEKDSHVALEYRLTHTKLPEDFTSYGCFMHRGKTKAGYSALLRLFFAAVSDKDRFALPAKLCRTSPPYRYVGSIPSEWQNFLAKFLTGESAALLQAITARLLEKENLPPYLYAPLQRDLRTAREFFDAGPASTRRLLKADKRPRARFMSQPEMERVAGEINRQFVRDLVRPAGPVITVGQSRRISKGLSAATRGQDSEIKASASTQKSRR